MHTLKRLGVPVLMADREAQRRGRAWVQAKNHREARDARAELRRMGRDPGPLLGAVARLARARQEDTEAGGS